MIINSQRTIYGLELQADMLAKGQYTPRVNTTLNEKYNIAADIAAASTDIFTIKYLAIGTGGIESVNPVTPPVPGPTGTYSYSEHSPLDATLFNQVPFIIRPVTSDILPAEQIKYRLRTIVTDNSGVDYYYYYLKALSNTDITTNTYIINTNQSQGVSNLSLFNTTNNSQYLTLDTAGSISNPKVNKQFVSKLIKVKFNLTPTELSEISNSITHIYGATANIAPTVLTEIGVCGGVDAVVGGITEAIQTQIYFHVRIDIDTTLAYDPTTGYTRVIELGGTEPIYV